MKTSYQQQIIDFLNDAVISGEGTIVKSIPGPEGEIICALDALVSDGVIIKVDLNSKRLSYCLKSVREMAIRDIIPLFSNSSWYFSAEDVKNELNININKGKVGRILRMLGSENLLTVNKFDGKYFFRNARFYGYSSVISFNFSNLLNEYRKNNGLLPDKPVFEIEKLNGETGLEL
ncbi:hypothetical protein IGP34_08180 [Escherichia coli]|uniref:hypothetical protein n=1 Tax=Escherichia coli TaxID=562 RepID=UPI00227160F5|nr:hypothetical protein [Escherichia coli]MCX9424209.1 hypothetical protein [Escherichia coli]